MPSPNARGHLTNRSGPAPFRNRPAGMSDSAIDRTLRKLGRANTKPGSVAETAASFARLNPGLSDDDIAQGLQVDPALVARVRANLAAGRPANHGLADGPPLRTDGPQGAPAPSPRSAPPPPRTPATAGPRPTYTVTAPNGTVTREIATYAAAADLALYLGGRVAAVRP